jgi:hypothetical protein
MIDVIKRKPLRVEICEGAPALLVLPVEQLDQARALLDAHKVPYWVSEEFLSVDGGPEKAFVHISRNADPAMVQRLLDDVP